jgi:sulfite reductase (ferredoxin)
VPKEISKVETIKETSRGLRGKLAQDLDDSAAGFDEAGKQLLKFHGLYQNDDRDTRRERKKQGLDPAYAFMVRARIPGGVITADQYLALDALSEQHADGDIRLTTRQAVQFYGIVKGDIKGTFQDLNDALITTLGACGDVVRNVMCCPAPHEDREHLHATCESLSDRLLPQTRAYHEIWLDGEKVVDTKQEVEPIYGNAYLPRKLKIGIALPDDNCVDVHTQDIGLIAIVEDGVLQGFNVLVGGGLGMTHGKEQTYPRLGSPIGFASADVVRRVVEGIITIQRDFGNREDRKQARLKYLIDDRGLDWFRTELHTRIGFELPPSAPTDPIQVDDHMGWHRQDGDSWYLGLPVENGRIRDDGSLQLRTALREVIQKHRPGVRITPQQSILLTDVAEEAIHQIDAAFRSHGVRLVEDITPARRWAMGCPALPTCSLALAESERVLPGLVGEIETELDNLGLGDEPIAIRMTGCPNGCARPFTAELAFVGRTLDKYNIYLGGNAEGTRLTEIYAEAIPTRDLVATVLPLFESWAEDRCPGERFGDYCDRIGVDELREHVELESRVPRPAARPPVITTMTGGT